VALPQLQLRGDDGDRASPQGCARPDGAHHDLPVLDLHRRRALRPRLRGRGGRRAHRVVPPSRLRTLTGLVRPGIFVKGIALKLVFEDDTVGCTRDIFWVPMSEVPAHLRDKQPLRASELDFASPIPPAVKVTPAGVALYERAMVALRQLAADVAQSRRAQKDLAGQTGLFGVKTSGGDFALRVADGRLSVLDGIPKEAAFIVVTEDPAVFTRWANDGSLTDAVVEGSLWLPHKEAFQLLPILDRLPRSTRRDLR
jgi:hypothetical protein